MAPLVREYAADAAPSGPMTTRQARNADTGNIGSALAQFGETAQRTGDLMKKRDGQAEVSSLSAQLAEAHADSTNALDETFQNADSNDRTVGDKFMDSYDDRMGQISDQITTPEGRAYFEKANTAMRGRFQVESMQSQARLSGQGAVDNLNHSMSSYSSGLLNDPSGFDSVRQQHDMAIQAQVDTGTINEYTANKLRDNSDKLFALAAVRGTIGLDAKQAKSQLANGQWDDYVNGDQKYALLKEADEGIRAKDIDAKRQDAVASQAMAQKQDAVQSQMLQKMYGSGLSTDEVLKDPTLDFGQKKQMIGMINSNIGDKIKTDPDTFLDLFGRIHAQDGDPNKITSDAPLTQAVIDKKLDITGLNQLRNEISGKNTPEGRIQSQLKNSFLGGVRGQLTKANPMLGIADPDGNANYTSFLYAFNKKYQEDKQAGVDVNARLQPTDPNYYGNLVKPFLRSPQDIMKSRAASFSSAPSGTSTQGAAAPPTSSAPGKPQAEPRRPGETPAQYRSRMSQ